VTYQASNPALFGGLLNGEGYWLSQNAAGNPFQFDGFRTDFADRYLGLPKTGITQFGHPYLFAMNWDEVLVTNGLETIRIADAANGRNPQWLDSIVRYWDARTQTEKLVGLPADNPDSIALQPWTGYRATSFVDNLALIFPLETHTGKPFIKDISPRLVAAGDPDFFLDIIGEGFASSSVVFWNGTPRVTFYTSPQKLRAAIPAALIALPGSASVQVGNPALGGALSKVQIVVIGSANLVLSGVSELRRANGQITATVKLTNIGVVPANNILVTGATINTTATLTDPLPQVNTIPAGGSKTVILTFPAGAGSPGANATLRLKATFNGGNFTGSRRIILP